MTDIVLVNPPLSGQERYGSLASGGVYMPPLGLANLAAYLRENKFSVKIVDCCALNLTLNRAVVNILGYEPSYVGVTAATISINKAALLAGFLKKERPDLKVIVGGCHLSAVPEETMRQYQQFDIGAIGEGELTLTELLRALSENSSLNRVKGIIFRSNGSIVKNEAGPFIKDLDSLPFPAWDLLPDIRRYYRPSSFGFKRLPSTSLITLRGCPMRCTFCSETPFARTCRTHSPEYVIGMIRHLQRDYQIKDLMIYDGTFVIDRPRVMRICELLIREKVNISWSCNGRIDLMTPEIIRLMKRSGCWSIAYGIESGSQRIIDFIQKGIDLERAREVLRWTRKEGILSKGYFMVGHLTEDKESLRSTLDFILKSDLDLITVTYFTPLPGTLDYSRASQYGKFNNSWYLLSFHNLVFIPFAVNEKILCFYRKYIVRRFYLRPKIILRYWKVFLNPQSFRVIFVGLLALIKLITTDRNRC